MQVTTPQCKALPKWVAIYGLNVPIVDYRNDRDAERIYFQSPLSGNYSCLALVYRKADCSLDVYLTSSEGGHVVRAWGQTPATFRSERWGEAAQAMIVTCTPEQMRALWMLYTDAKARLARVKSPGRYVRIAPARPWLARLLAPLVDLIGWQIDSLYAFAHPFSPAAKLAA